MVFFNCYLCNPNSYTSIGQKVMLIAIRQEVKKSCSEPYNPRLKSHGRSHAYRGWRGTYIDLQGTLTVVYMAYLRWSIHTGITGGIRRLDKEVGRGPQYILTCCLPSEHASLACRILRSVLYPPYSHFGKKTLQKSASWSIFGQPERSKRHLIELSELLNLVVITYYQTE